MRKLAVLGYGNIGNGVCQVVEKSGELLAERLGEGIEVKYVLDIRDFPGDFMEKKVVHDVELIINDPENEVVCETIGGVHPAYDYTKQALEAGKSVCTSNKELVAQKGAELQKIAKAHGCNYFFEACVGGGIPLIRTIASSLAS
ncbi:MAG: homoserine dehydrogenase, partial [Lachnospiraceae bacterium]|nr:homoserine dehydrogenase [Lachnospiraceae bacterium]